MVLYLLLGQGPTGGWHPAPRGAVGISPKLKSTLGIFQKPFEKLLFTIYIL